MMIARSTDWFVALAVHWDASSGAIQESKYEVKLFNFIPFSFPNFILLASAQMRSSTHVGTVVKLNWIKKKEDIVSTSFFTFCF